MEYFKEVDWHTIATYSNRVFIINKDKPEEYLVLENRNKQDFDAVEVFVDQELNTVNYYKILQKVIDKRGNLVLLTEKEESI